MIILNAKTWATTVNDNYLQIWQKNICHRLILDLILKLILSLFEK